MAASLQPDPNQLNTPASSEPSPNNPTLEPSQSPPTQPTNPPQAPPTSEYTRLLEEGLREANQRFQAQHDELTRLRQSSTLQQPAAPAQNDPTSFFNDPHGALAASEKRIMEAMKQTVAPLQQFVTQMSGGNLKSQFATDPRYSDLLSDPKISIAVDKILENMPNATPEIMAGAITQAAGLRATGQLDMALVRAGVDISRYSAPQPPASPPVPPRITPPHVPPTPPAAPIQHQPQDAVMPLTELQKRLAREKGMSEDDYRAWLSAPANAVAGSKIGRPQP